MPPMVGYGYFLESPNIGIDNLEMRRFILSCEFGFSFFLVREFVS